MHLHSSIVRVISLVLLTCPLLRAQTPYPYDPVQDVYQNPLKSYHGSDIDSVDLDTGVLTVKIPLISYPQRGGVLHLDFVAIPFSPANSTFVENVYHVPNGPTYYSWSGTYLGKGDAATLIGANCPTGLPGLQGVFPPLATGSFPSLTTVSTQQGTSYDYQQGWVVESDCSTHLIGWIPNGQTPTQGRTVDNSGFLVNNMVYPLSITSADGVTTTWSTSGSSVSAVASDANGNQITMSSSGIKDTFGRTIPAQTPTASGSTWSVPGVNGGNELFTSSQNGNTSSITLPNGTSYTFQSTAENLPLLPGQTSPQTAPLLTTITLPTGGAISYTYYTPITSVCGSGVDTFFPVHTRTVNANDGTGPHTWTYSFSISGTSSGTTTVIDPLGDKTVYAYGLTSCAPYPTEIQFFDNNNNLQKTVMRTYSYFTVGTQLVNVNMMTETIIWPSGQQSQTSYKYDRDNGFYFPGSALLFINGGVIGYEYQNNTGYTSIPFTITQSDYGNPSPGPTLRQTNTTYQAFSGPGAASYLAANLIAKPYTVTVSSGAGVQMSLTQYNYDETTPVTSGLTSSYQWSAPTTQYRGNNTSVYRWLNSGSLTCQNGGAGGTNGYVTSRKTYYDGGMLQTSSDPCTNTTTYNYSSTYWYALPTTVINALSQSTTHTYDFNTGLLTSTTDSNGLTTLYGYDNMWRLHSTTTPDGGIDTTNYQETTTPFTATYTTAINASLNKTEVNVFDGLGRVYQHQLTSDPQSTVYTDTTYDALGRVHSVSNPYRTCGGADLTSSCGTTTYGYDPLNRNTSETYPDNSVLTTAYCGPSTLVTDPTKRWRRSRVDGLARLVEVDEPNAIGASVSPNGCPGSGESIWVTTYTVDALSNLTNVVQNGSHRRAFSYDSLSRLLTSTNPETGTLTYTYYPDGPLSSGTDARAIKTSYTYDALHRELTRSYSNGEPTVTMTYDQSNCLGLSACQNIGHRTSMTDAAGSEAWAYEVDKTNLRSIRVDQRTNQTPTIKATRSSTAYYDLAGNVTQLIYPAVNARVVNYQFNGANRPMTAADGSNGLTYATGFQTPPANTNCTSGSACYTPQGTVYAVSTGQFSGFTGKFSSFSGFNITNIYNNRLQPQEFKASSSTGGNALDISYTYVDPVNGGNAGHVFTITNNLDNRRTQNFTYDQLNRITSASTVDTSGQKIGNGTYNTTLCWGYQYSYDAWGNLLAQAPWTPTYSACSETTMSTLADGNNHVSGLSYDAAGNTTNDGSYTYTWNAENQMTAGGSDPYIYDGDGHRILSEGAAWWYGPNGEVLSNTDGYGNPETDYIYFDGHRIAAVPPNISTNWPELYAWDALGSTHATVSDNTTTTYPDAPGSVTWDSDFTPFGGENAIRAAYEGPFKFEGKMTDFTGNDFFGARHYSSRFGRWLSADWSSVPVPVPYANLTNPQTLNLYSMVADDPESFADLDGHDPEEPGPSVITQIETGLDQMSAEANAVADEVGLGMAAKGMGTAVGIGAVIGVEIYALIDAKATQTKADADMKMQGIINSRIQEMNKKKDAKKALEEEKLKEHKSDKRESTKDTHEDGISRKRRDRGGEKGDETRQKHGMWPRKRPKNWNEPWPPKPQTPSGQDPHLDPKKVNNGSAGQSDL